MPRTATAKKPKAAPAPPQEKPFQQVANEYAHGAIESLRDMVEALEHAEECDGTVECDFCGGSGREHETVEDDTPCHACKGTCTVPCTKGQETVDIGDGQRQLCHSNPDAWHDAEAAQRSIQEDPLSVEVRSDWHTPGDEDANEPTEYNILLGTGGPAARIIGELDQYQQPTTARFQYQDWFKPWTDAQTTSDEDAVMLKYAQQFYFSN